MIRRIWHAAFGHPTGCQCHGPEVIPEGVWVKFSPSEDGTVTVQLSEYKDVT